jgi:hypothetical protein
MIKSLSQRLADFGQTHRMKMGLHPDNQLIDEAVSMLALMEADVSAVKAPTVAPTKKGRKV